MKTWKSAALAAVTALAFSTADAEAQDLRLLAS